MAELSKVLWIGGPSGAGKTTVARLLARRHGLRRYSGDTRTWVHRDRAAAAGAKLPPRGPGEEYYDRGPMIVDDLRSLPQSPLIVAESGGLTPSMVAPMIRAVWLLPSLREQHARLEQRHPDGVPESCIRSWHAVVEQLGSADVTVVTVDGQTMRETVDAVERQFEPVLAEGPTAKTIEQRRELVRESNQALADQYLSPLARPKSPREPRTTVRTFDCECGSQTCTALLDLSLAEAATVLTSPPPSILATGHDSSAAASSRGTT